jgi:thymidylate synthase (FAD)
LNHPIKTNYKNTDQFLYEDNIGLVKYVDHMGSDLKVVNAARNSYYNQSENFTQKDEELLNFLMKEGHFGVLEHNIVTFGFFVPIFVSRQFHRHRTWSYNEVSRRYTSIKIQFYIPPNIRTQDSDNKQSSVLIKDPELYLKYRNLINDININSHEKYKELLKAGICREQARGALNQNLYTSFWGTANLRNIIHFIQLREDPHAQWEIQVVAKAMRNICEELFPKSLTAIKTQVITGSVDEEKK